MLCDIPPFDFEYKQYSRGPNSGVCAVPKLGFLRHEVLNSTVQQCGMSLK